MTDSFTSLHNQMKHLNTLVTPHKELVNSITLAKMKIWNGAKGVTPTVNLEIQTMLRDAEAYHRALCTSTVLENEIAYAQRLLVEVESYVEIEKPRVPVAQDIEKKAYVELTYYHVSGETPQGQYYILHEIRMYKDNDPRGKYQEWVGNGTNAKWEKTLSEEDVIRRFPSISIDKALAELKKLIDV